MALLAVALLAAGALAATTPPPAPAPAPQAAPPGGCGKVPATRPCLDYWACVDGTWEPVYLLAGTPCDDRNACTYADQCQGGPTCRGTPITCVSEACISRSCNGTSTCTIAPKTGVACEDGNACTYDDRCDAAGRCVSGPAVVCASDTCATRACNGSSTCSVTFALQGKACGTSSAPCAAACNAAGSCSSSVKASRGAICPFPTACAQVCDGVSGSCQPQE